ncbi:MAG: DUF167 domain-containing protein [Chloroflexi bacterium]|nr:DUF167 domain-containing protein [Chloroflexota bacterium]
MRLTTTLRAGRIHFAVHVIPRASRAEIAGEREGALLIRVTAAPAEDAANEAVVALLAKALDVARGEVSIERGGRARDKAMSVPESARGRLRALRS